MRCPACGVSVVDEARYCHQCGASLELEGDEPRRVSGRSASTDTSEGPQEEELWQGSFSWKGMAGQFALGIIVTIILAVVALVAAPSSDVAMGLGAIIIAIWLILFGLLAYRRLSVLYRITSQRFIHKAGILYRVTDRVEMIDIDDVRLTESLLERLFGTGTIYLRSSDRTHPELRLPGIDRARLVAGLIDDARRKERLRRGLHIESI